MSPLRLPHPHADQVQAQRPKRSTPAARGRLAALVVGLVLSAGCSSSSGQAAVTTTTAPPTTATTTTSTTLPTTTTAPLTYFPTHEQAADHLYQAWQHGDRAAALQGATTAAVDALFAIPPRGWVRYYYGGYCDTGEFDRGTCNFRSDDKYARVVAQRSPQGWIVTQVIESDGL